MSAAIGWVEESWSWVVGPGLLGRAEGRPRTRPLGGLGLAGRRRPLGERLVEPEVVPPLHRHEVAEPHVRELVQDRQRAALDLGLGDLAAEDVDLGEGHGAGVLHRAHVVLGREDLVVLLEGVGLVELLLEEGEALLRAVEDVVGVEVLRSATCGRRCRAARRPRGSAPRRGPRRTGRR